MECPICHQDLFDKQIFSCLHGHLTCQKCLEEEERINLRKPACSICREPRRIFIRQRQVEQLLTFLRAAIGIKCNWCQERFPVDVGRYHTAGCGSLVTDCYNKITGICSLRATQDTFRRQHRHCHQVSRHIMSKTTNRSFHRFSLTIKDWINLQSNTSFVFLPNTTTR